MKLYENALYHRSEWKRLVSKYERDGPSSLESECLLIDEQIGECESDQRKLGMAKSQLNIQLADALDPSQDTRTLRQARVDFHSESGRISNLFSESQQTRDRLLVTRETIRILTDSIDEYGVPVAPDWLGIEESIRPEYYELNGNMLRWISAKKATLGALLYHRRRFFDSIPQMIEEYKGYIEFGDWNAMDATIYSLDKDDRKPRIDEDTSAKIAEQIQRITGRERV